MIGVVTVITLCILQMGKLSTESREVKRLPGSESGRVGLGLEPTQFGLNKEEELGKGYSGSRNSECKGSEIGTGLGDG